MDNWITQFMEQFGYFAIVLLMAGENVFPPIPSEIILLFGGFLTTTSGSVTVVGVIIAATIGAVIGAIILYGIGLLLDVERLEKIVDRWGHILRIKKEDIHKADAWFDKYGVWTIFLCRFVPVIRSLISIPAGMSNMNFPLFLIFTTLGTLIWNTVLVLLGFWLGESWTSVETYLGYYQDVVIVVLAIIIVLFVIWFIRRNKKKKSS
ncbi:DedA family protein [Terribacillus saccharophilus]|uniref:Alkaline phosphatase n=1 Tax=Terribacillus saccharophilus TaxID=361277 RepID=A0A075LN69_9BACI|nr:MULTISPECIES: DedA family protein [Terribacillus]AIF68160.1 alkaline phosphatase [Terribacillus goriensis]MCM3226396.1 DedA family protein [Terribacillus saccharophilus]MEC0282351.1 DedA family protein [Terribacillus saccharophilus]MEC0288890.1 DedA family protein [Terribacillus saccharophilus]MEC0303418.1 DedA family protein [Terribacillus saccharophilus]